MLIPLVIAAFFAGVSVAGLRSMERDIPKLIGEVNGILDSIATLAALRRARCQPVRNNIRTPTMLPERHQNANDAADSQPGAARLARAPRQ
jgi:hypothetical protein